MMKKKKKEEVNIEKKFGDLISEFGSMKIEDPEQEKLDLAIEKVKREFSSKKRREPLFIINMDESTIPNELRDDESFIRQFSYIGPMIKIASKRLKNKKGLIFDLTKDNPANMTYASTSLRRDSEFCASIIKRNIKNVDFISVTLLENQNFLKTILEYNWEIGYYITEKFGYLLTPEFLDSLEVQTGFINLYLSYPLKQTNNAPMHEHKPLTNISMKFLMKCISGEISTADKIIEDPYYFKSIFEVVKMSNRIKKNTNKPFTFDSLVDLMVDYEDRNGYNRKSVLKIVLRSHLYLIRNKMIIEEKTLSAINTCIDFNAEQYIMKTVNDANNKLEGFKF